MCNNKFEGFRTLKIHHWQDLKRNLHAKNVATDSMTTKSWNHTTTVFMKHLCVPTCEECKTDFMAAVTLRITSDGAMKVPWLVEFCWLGDYTLWAYKQLVLLLFDCVTCEKVVIKTKSSTVCSGDVKHQYILWSNFPHSLFQCATCESVFAAIGT